MDSISDSIFTMLQLQRALNDREDKDWFSKQPPFLREVFVAAATTLGHYGCGIWATLAPDLQQVRHDMSGMLYLLLSNAMARKGRRDEELYLIAKEIEAVYRNIQRADAHSERNFPEKIEILAAKAALRENAALWPAFFSAARVLELDWKTLSHTYFSENVLKLFRHDYGQDEATYAEIWGEKEDRVHLEEIISGMEKLDLPAIRHALVLRYSILTGRRAADKTAPPRQ